MHAITVVKAINRIAKARIELIDGDPSVREFPITDSDAFKPGATVDIQAGYDNNNHSIFKGLVIGLQLDSRGTLGTFVTVLCQDEAVKMNGSRVVKPFAPQTASATIEQIVGQYPGLTSTIASTSTVQNNLVQYNRTDWDFVVTQAEANGQVVVNDMGNLQTVALATPTATLALVYGTNVYDLSLRLDARTQFASVTAQSWSAAQQQDITATASTPDLMTLGNLTSNELAAAVGQQTYAIRTAADVDQATLQALADAYLAKRTLAVVQGTVDMPGDSTVSLSTIVSLSKLAARFSGPGFLSGIRHVIKEGNWKTQLSLGTDEQWFAEQNPNVVAPAGNSPAATGMQGLYSAVVKALQPDADGAFRVPVTVAALDNAVLWVRQAQPEQTEAPQKVFFRPFHRLGVVIHARREPRPPHSRLVSRAYQASRPLTPLFAPRGAGKASPKGETMGWHSLQTLPGTGLPEPTNAGECRAVAGNQGYELPIL